MNEKNVYVAREQYKLYALYGEHLAIPGVSNLALVWHH